MATDDIMMADDSQIRSENDSDEDIGPFEYDEESENLVVDFDAHPDGKDALKKIGEEIHTEVVREWEDQEEYRDRWKENWKLFIGNLPPKKAPYQDCANVAVPIVPENMMRLVFKMCGELFGDWSKVYGIAEQGAGDTESVTMTLHGNWQLREQIKDFSRQMFRGVLLYLFGDVVCDSYYDEKLKVNRHEMLTVDEYLIPHTHSTTMPDLSDCPWVVRFRWMYKHQLEEKRKVWQHVKDVLKESASTEDEFETKLEDAVADSQGIDKDDARSGGPYRIIQWTGWLTLPNQDRQRYVRVFMDSRSRKIMMMRIHEEPNWDERIRYEKQMAEMDEYRSLKSNYDMALMANGQAGMAAVLQAPAPPMPPAWMRDTTNPDEQPEPMEKQPIYLMSHGVCIESLTGSIGIGVANMVAELERAANIVLSQYIDSATLGNIASYIATSDVDWEEPYQVSPGRINVVTGIGMTDLKNVLMKQETQPANPQMMGIVQVLYNWGQTVGQSPQILSGGEVKSGEPYRSTASRMEMAMQQLTEMTRNFANTILKQILTNNMWLNARLLPDEVEFSVPSFEGGAVQRVTRLMYQQARTVVMGADMRYATMAVRIQEADEIVKMGMASPELAQRAPFMYWAWRKALESRGRYDMVQYMGPEPQNYPIPFGELGAGVAPGGGGPQGGGAPKPEGPPGENPEPTPMGTGAPETAPRAGGAQSNTLAPITR